MLRFKTDPKTIGFPSYSIHAASEAEYVQLVAFVEANCQLAPGYLGELPAWNEEARPSIVYATDQHLVFYGSQIRDALKGARQCVGVAEFMALLADDQRLYAKPTPTQTTHTITLTDEQFDAACDALEYVSRFLSGQIDEFTLPAGLLISPRQQQNSEGVKAALDYLKRQLFPELEGPGHSYGVGAAQDTEPIARTRVVLYEVYRTMLEHKVQLRIRAGDDVGMNVYAHPGLNYTGLPKPIITSQP